MRITAFTEAELTELLIRAANLGASQALRSAAPKEVMTKKELAEYLRVTIPTIDKWMRDGLPFVKVGNGNPRYYKTSVDEWIGRQ